MSRRVLPGFGLTLGLTLVWLSVLVLIPLSAVVLYSCKLGWAGFVAAAFDDRAWAAYKLTFGASAVAALVNSVAGLIVAWVLVRYEFPGRRVVDAMVDLPFALPTAVAGIALTALTMPTGWVGQLVQPLGIKLAFTPAGVTLALIFIGLPFVVRTVQPVLAELEPELEEAGATLGASRAQIWWRVVWPEVRPALLTGATLAFARSLGEYGSVVFISGNQPWLTEIAPLLVVMKLEAYDYAGATAVATVLLVFSLGVLLVVNTLQRRLARRGGSEN